MEELKKHQLTVCEYLLLVFSVRMKEGEVVNYKISWTDTFTASFWALHNHLIK